MRTDRVTFANAKRGSGNTLARFCVATTMNPLLLIAGILVAVAACVSPAPRPSPDAQFSCELSTTSLVTCARIVEIAQAEVGIRPGARIRVVDPLGGASRTGLDVGLVVVSYDRRTSLVLVGYVGIGETPVAWVPDRNLYPDWYAKYVDHRP